MVSIDAPSLGRQADRIAALRPGGAGRGAMVIGAAVLAGVLAILGARWWTATGYQPAPAGLPDAGAVTSVGLPVMQFVQRVAGIAVVGLLFLRCLGGLSPVSADHLAAMTIRWAVAWAAGSAAVMVFTASYLIGVPVSALPTDLGAVVVLLGSQQLLAQMATLWPAVLVALFGRRLSGAVGNASLLVVSAAALLPGALAGHAGHHGSPATAMAALGLHVVTAAIWVGGLLALVVHLRPFPSDLARLLPRFSTAALICLVAVGISGVAESVLMLDGWNALLTTGRGQLIIVKAAAIALLAAVGHGHRRFTMGAAAAGRMLPLLRLAGVEITLMAATIGIAVMLSRTG